MADEHDKTEPATPERRRKAREEGQFPRARDAGNTAGSIAVLMMIGGFGPQAVTLLGQFSTRCFSEPYTLVRGDPQALVRATASVLGGVALPFAVAAAIGALVVGFLEAGFHPNLALAEPKFERLEPLGKLKNMFSPQQGAVSVLLQATRVAIVTAIAYHCVKKWIPLLTRLSSNGLGEATRQAGTAIFDLAIWSTVALALLALVDYLYSKFRHEQSIRMSKHEIKEESRQQDGDPKVKSKQRARAREIVRRGLVQAVRSADFVVVNPTHVSVAIRYRADVGAPVVTAKGYDEIALHIRKLAKEHNIAMVENVPLARALASRVKVGRSIPVDLYSAVAEVLAFVYRLKNRMPEILS
jgi:flagellar biosynthetic protein FlhB